MTHPAVEERLAGIDTWLGRKAQVFSRSEWERREFDAVRLPLISVYGSEMR
jgi:hypothetical protein